jgi:hypothetical protein
LKKIWVEKQKIKSKWKAIKRKEGLGKAVPTDNVAGGNEAPEVLQHSDLEPDAAESSVQVHDKDSDTPMKPNVLPSKTQQHKSPARNQMTTQPSTGSQRNADHSAVDMNTHAQTSLRDLARIAYSRSSLHTYKSDPLHRKGSGHPGEKSQRGRGVGGARGERRGQPNMKLRMDVMLEKIKRDFT